jgi:hypothetical protein
VLTRHSRTAKSTEVAKGWQLAVKHTQRERAIGRTAAQSEAALTRLEDTASSLDERLRASQQLVLELMEANEAQVSDTVCMRRRRRKCTGARTGDGLQAAEIAHLTADSQQQRFALDSLCTAERARAARLADESALAKATASQQALAEALRREEQLMVQLASHVGKETEPAGPISQWVGEKQRRIGALTHELAHHEAIAAELRVGLALGERAALAAASETSDAEAAQRVAGTRLAAQLREALDVSESLRRRIALLEAREAQAAAALPPGPTELDTGSDGRGGASAGAEMLEMVTCGACGLALRRLALEWHALTDCGAAGGGGGGGGGGSHLCDDCGGTMSAAHAAQCHLRRIACAHCGARVSAPHLADHHLACEKHVRKCGDCGVVVSIGAMRTHLRAECMRRLEACCYCVHMVPARLLAEHQARCCARPSECRFCGAQFQLDAKVRAYAQRARARTARTHGHTHMRTHRRPLRPTR